MTTTFITTATTAPLSTDGFDEIYVAPEGSITGTSALINVSGVANFVTVDGVVASGTNAVNVQTDAEDTSIYVGSTGRVVGMDANFNPIELGGINNSLVNDGTIQGGFGPAMTGGGGVLINRGLIASVDRGIADAAGVTLRTTDLSVLNSGEITGAVFGINEFLGTATNARIVNTGSISGGVAIDIDNGAGVTIENSGEIVGLGGVAIDLGGDTASVENSGSIIGDVQLGNAGDTYRAFADGLVQGEVFGAGGDDILYGGSLEDALSGDAGMDELRGRAGDDIVLGCADDDLVAGNQGDDRVDGNQGDDRLFGNRGDDIVRGGSGDDRISGGAGNDVLTGNSGMDVFVFNRRTDDDIITDFKNNFDALDLTAFGLANVAALRDAGGIVANGDGSIIDLTVIGGDGVIYVDDMSVTDWTGLDFIL